MPSGTEEVLNKRTLSSSHRRLGELLQPGMRVLDVGCGTGAITKGMFEVTDPGGAIECCSGSVVPGGKILVLDYNHEKIAWDPRPPSSMMLFYEAFLAWRSDAGMDNAIADHLAYEFERLGLTDIQVTEQREHSDSLHANDKSRLAIWSSVAATRGQQMVKDGYLTELQRATAETDYREWTDATAVSQTLYLLAVEGRVTGRG